MALEGQSIDITRAPVGTYYLVSHANPLNFFFETDPANHDARVEFNFERNSNGNPKIVITDHSECDQKTGLCGDNLPNR